MILKNIFINLEKAGIVCKYTTQIYMQQQIEDDKIIANTELYSIAI